MILVCEDTKTLPRATNTWSRLHRSRLVLACTTLWSGYSAQHSLSNLIEAGTVVSGWSRSMACILRAETSPMRFMDDGVSLRSCSPRNTRVERLCSILRLPITLNHKINQMSSNIFVISPIIIKPTTYSNKHTRRHTPANRVAFERNPSIWN